MPAPASLLTSWAELVIESLTQAGVRDFVVSPGSRSTPFALAAARSARARVHGVIDERSAGFFALGMARATGRAAVLLCTSGSAPAHYFPAVLEASEACLPLVVLSADRPRRLTACGASQTTDQVHLFGRHVRYFSDLPRACETAAVLRSVRRACREAVAHALGPTPGPVHLNARADKPLEPVSPETPRGHALADAVRALTDGEAPARVSQLAIDDGAIDVIAVALSDAARPVCIAGPRPVGTGDRHAIVSFLREQAIPLLAEASSQLRFVGDAELVTADTFDRWIGRGPSPDVVIEIGHTPTSAHYARWLQSSGPNARFVVGDTRFRDPHGTADRVVLGDLGAIFERLTARCDAPTGRDESFVRDIEDAEAETWAATETALAEAGAHGMAEGSAVRAVIASLPVGAQLGLGNSLPIRHADRFVPGRVADVSVLSQRGLAGIDGWIASAAGAATAARRPTAFIIGDVTFAHDVGSLALLRAVEIPTAIVVLDNGGGRIFEQLPIAEAQGDMSLFTTPPNLDIESAARAFGVAYRRPERPEALEATMRAALANRAATIVHVVVPTHGASALEARVEALLERTR